MQVLSGFCFGTRVGAGKGWGNKVNCIYIWGKCRLHFVNGNMGGICFGRIDWDFGMWKTLWETRERVGFCWVEWMWETFY